MTKTRKQELWEEAERQRQLCRDWLLQFMDRPKTRTKDELRAEAVQHFNVSKSSFDAAWIWAIEETGRQDWYEPLRGRKKK